LLVRLPNPHMVHLELKVYSLDGSASLELQAGKDLFDTYTFSDGPSVITTPALSLPAGESVIYIRANAVPANLVFERINLVIDE